MGFLDEKSGSDWFTGTCPSCGRSDWCQQSNTGAYMCRRGPAPGLVARRDRSGVPYWLFIPEGQGRINLQPSSPDVERAEVGDLHRFYSTLLGWLGLSEEHLQDWRRRGVSREVVERHCVRTWPPTRGERQLMASELYREFGEVCRRVPGWYIKNGKPMLSGGTGWVIPMWDLETGGVCALRMRSDSVRPGFSRYYWISSGGDKGGASSGNHARLAWPGRHPERHDRADIVRITEGEAKSIVLAEYTGIPTISVPGVSSWREALPWLKWLKAERVRICFDMDFATNANVARAMLETKTHLPRYGYTAKLETWKKKR